MLITHYIIVPQCILYISYCTAGTVCISLLYRYILQLSACTVLLYFRGIVQLWCCTVDLYSSSAVQSYLYIFWNCTVVLVQLWRCTIVLVHPWRCTLDSYSSGAVQSYLYISGAVLHFCYCLVSLTLTAYLVRLLRIEMAILLEYLWRELNFYSYPSCAGHG